LKTRPPLSLSARGADFLLAFIQRGGFFKRIGGPATDHRLDG
jgi:hypothetical protein